MKESFKKELLALKKLRDELAVQAHLGKMEAKDALIRVENELPGLEAKFDESIEKASAAVKDALKDAQKALDRVREH